jgi:predicted ester cyclase
MKRHGHLIGAASFLLVFLAACGSPAPPPVAATPPAPKPPTDQERLQKYQDCWGYYNDKKFDQLKDCYDASATSQQIGYGKGGMVSGADAIVSASQEQAKAMPDVRGDAQLILVNGNHVAGIYLLKGTNSAPMTGADGKEMPATNKKFALMFGHSVEFAPTALKAVTETGVMDSVTFASQLGLAKQRVRAVIETGVASPEIVMAQNNAAEKAIIDVETAQIAAWNKHDSAGVTALVADNSVFHDMTGPKDSNKKQGEQMDAGYWKAFPDANLVIHSMWAAGDYVVFTGNFEGTNDGAMPAMGIAKKTGKKVSVPFLEIDKFVAGKNQESWLFFDAAQFGAQLGLTGKK